MPYCFCFIYEIAQVIPPRYESVQDPTLPPTLPHQTLPNTASLHPTPSTRSPSALPPPKRTPAQHARAQRNPHNGKVHQQQQRAPRPRVTAGRPPRHEVGHGEQQQRVREPAGGGVGRARLCQRRVLSDEEQRAQDGRRARQPRWCVARGRRQRWRGQRES